MATTHPSLIEIELILQPNHLGNLMCIILHAISHVRVRWEGDLVLLHHHPVINEQPPNRQQVYQPTTSNFTDGASFVHTPLEQAPRRELLPANPHVVLPDEALAAGPPHGHPVAPRRRDEAGNPAVARALALVAYEDAAAQIRDVDGVRDVVVAGHVVLVLGRAYLHLLGVD